MEPTVKIEFNSQELQTLGAIIDVAIKAMGIQGAMPAALIYNKLEAAVKEVNGRIDEQPANNDEPKGKPFRKR
jgi:hypothetical protein